MLDERGQEALHKTSQYHLPPERLGFQIGSITLGRVP